MFEKMLSIKVDDVGVILVCKISRRSAPLGPRSEGGPIDPLPPPPSKNLLSKSPLKIGLKGKFSSGKEGALASQFNYDSNFIKAIRSDALYWFLFNV